MQSTFTAHIFNISLALRVFCLPSSTEAGISDSLRPKGTWITVPARDETFC